MRKYLQAVLLAVGLLAPTVAFAQDTKTISTAGANCSTATNCAIFGVRNYPSIGIYLNVATSGTFVFEATTDNNPATGSWFAVNDDVGGTGTASADGYVAFSNPGYTYIRIRASAINGAATVTASKGLTGMRSTATLSGSSQGDGAILDGANPTIEATVADLASSNPVVIACANPTTGVLEACGGGSGGAAQTDNSTLGNITGSGALYDTTPPTITDGNVGIPRMDPNRYLYAVFPSAQAVSQSGTWTMQPGNTANTTPWLASISQGGNTALVSAAGRVSVDASGTSLTVGTHAVTGSGTFTVDSELTTADLDTGAGTDTRSVLGLVFAASGGATQVSASSGLPVNIVAGSSAGPTDTADSSVATGQTSGLVIAQNYVNNGSAWVPAAPSLLTEATHNVAVTPASTVSNALMGYASTSAPTAVTSGNAVLAWFNTDGRLNVADGGGSLTVDGSISCSNCSGSGASDVDNSTFTLGTDSGAPIMGYVDATSPTNATEDRMATIRATVDRSLHTSLRDAAGNNRGANVNASNELLVALSSVPSHAVTNAGVFVTQENGAALTALQLIDNLPNTIGSTTSGQSGALSFGAVTTAAPTYTTAQSNPLSLQTDGSLRTAVTNTVTVAAHNVTNAGTFPTQSTLQAGTAFVGTASVGATATTTDSGVECPILSAASTNATNCKASAGNFYGFDVYNTTTTTYYLRLYNLGAAPTCSSATGFIRSIPIPPGPSAGQVAGIVRLMPVAVGYSAGIGYCLTGGSAGTDNTNAAVGIFGAIIYK